MDGREPGYLKLFATGELEDRAKEAAKHLVECNLCPHACGVNRKDAAGFCGAPGTALVASYGPHYGEEKVLVGENGSGTIFFSYCNMRCVFCQNWELSCGREGEPVLAPDLAGIMLQLQENFGCHNINLVTPTHFIPCILKALCLAAKQGLRLPLVYNCGGYERAETLELLTGIISIYMPDFKYDLPEWGKKYSGVGDYPAKVKAALKEMDRQVGGLQTDERGIAFQGLLIRHLLMPGGMENTKKVLEFIKEELSPGCMVNLMDQYYPAHQAYEYKEIARPISARELEEALLYARKLNIRLAE